MPVLLKGQLASAPKRVIVTGHLHAGPRVTETGWPQQFSVARTSVRTHARARNPVLAEIGAKFLLLLFAFIQIRILTREPGQDAWIGGLPNHGLLLHMIRVVNPFLAGQRLQHCIRPFAASAYAVWKNGGRSIEAHHNGQRSSGRKG